MRLFLMLVLSLSFAGVYAQSDTLATLNADSYTLNFVKENIQHRVYEADVNAGSLDEAGISATLFYSENGYRGEAQYSLVFNNEGKVKVLYYSNIDKTSTKAIYKKTVSVNVNDYNNLIIERHIDTLNFYFNKELLFSKMFNKGHKSFLSYSEVYPLTAKPSIKNYYVHVLKFANEPQPDYNEILKYKLHDYNILWGYYMGKSICIQDKQTNLYGYADPKSGAITMQPQLIAIPVFKNGKALVQKSKGECLINDQGKVLIDGTNLYGIRQGITDSLFYLVTNDNQFALADWNGTIKIPYTKKYKGVLDPREANKYSKVFFSDTVVENEKRYFTIEASKGVYFLQKKNLSCKLDNSSFRPNAVLLTVLDTKNYKHVSSYYYFYEDENDESLIFDPSTLSASGSRTAFPGFLKGFVYKFSFVRFGNVNGKWDITKANTTTHTISIKD